MSPLVLKLKSTSPSQFFQPSTLTPITDSPTGPYFLYGTLADPFLLSEILGLANEPEYRPAFVKGYKCKLWGQYPALLEEPESVVEGIVYHVLTKEHGNELAAYETGNYRAEPCRIVYTDGYEPAQDSGYTFKFVGNVKDLSDGAFDLGVWLKRVGR
ncbi:gamma-glutamylcyclotransferase family protein [Aspergillus alliaceus]|nr:uncharacterized protein BDW43DRAFT_269201 [Aspergillus alliaceus]KAB8235576.1 hypothetical protein BDW43DRAFT_269201 [Aspergillus alliaceus]